MIVRFSEKDLEGGSYLPEGEHEVTIANVEISKSKAGEDMCVFTVKDSKGREAKEYILTNEASRWKLAKFAIAAGVSKDVLRSTGLNIPSLAGKRLLMVKKQTGVEQYQGKEVKRYSQEYFPLQNQAATQNHAAPSSNDDLNW